MDERVTPPESSDDEELQYLKNYNGAPSVINELRSIKKGEGSTLDEVDIECLMKYMTELGAVTGECRVFDDNIKAFMKFDKVACGEFLMWDIEYSEAREVLKYIKRLEKRNNG